MAVSTPYALQNASHSAALFRQAVSSVVPNAGGLVQTGDLAVTQTGTASMAVVVGVGRAWVPGTNTANFSGKTYSSQAQYFALNDANVTLTINAADPTNPRIDVVCLTVNDSQYAGSTDSAVLQVITGTPAASPVAPVAPANSLVLANVSVAANATSISNSNITAQQTHGLAAPGTLQGLTTSDGTWSYNCQLLTEYTGDGHTYCTLQFIVARISGGAFTVNTGAWTSLLSGLIPSGYRPTDNITVGGTYEFNGLGSALFKVGTDGSVSAAGVTGSFSCGTPTKLSFTAAWKVS